MLPKFKIIYATNVYVFVTVSMLKYKRNWVVFLSS